MGLSIIWFAILFATCHHLTNAWEWNVEEHGDPFVGIRFREILTLSCHNSTTSSPWTCPENSTCIARPGKTNICVCDEGYINPNPYEYGISPNTNDHKNGTRILIMRNEFHTVENTSSEYYVIEITDSDEDGEYEDENEGKSNDDEDAQETDEGEGMQEVYCMKDHVELHVDDPRWRLLAVPCRSECPANAECRNGRDCFCKEGYYGNPDDEFKTCSGGIFYRSAATNILLSVLAVSIMVKYF